MSFHIGIDVSKDSFDLCVLDARQTVLQLKLPNSPNGFDRLIRALGRLDEGVELDALEVCLEPTSTYHLALCFHLHDHGVSIRQVTVGLAYTNYIKGLGRQHKTDRIDAWKLAMLHFERRELLTNQWHPRSKVIIKMRALTRRREQLMRTMRAESNRIEAYSQPGSNCTELVESCKRVRALLKDELEKVERALEQMVAQDEELSRKCARVRTIPQIGKVVSMVLVAELGAVGGFDKTKKAVSWAGLDAVAHESGTSVNAARVLSKKGNPRVRKALYQAALGTLREESPWHDYAMSKNQSGKPLIVAMMDKLLRVAVGVLKHDRDFDMNVCVSA